MPTGAAVEKKLSLEILMYIFIILLLLLSQVAGMYFSVINVATSGPTVQKHCCNYLSSWYKYYMSKPIKDSKQPSL